MFGFASAILSFGGTCPGGGNGTPEVAEHSFAGTEAREHDHDAHAGLEAWHAGREKEHWAFCAIADDAHTGPDVDRMVEAIAALGHKHDTFAVVTFCFVNGVLKRNRGIGAAVGTCAKFRRIQVYGLWVFQTSSIDRLRKTKTDRARQQQQRQKSLHGPSAVCLAARQTAEPEYWSPAKGLCPWTSGNENSVAPADVYSVPGLSPCRLFSVPLRPPFATKKRRGLSCQSPGKGVLRKDPGYHRYGKSHFLFAACPYRRG